jgi:hypothetical protein
MPQQSRAAALNLEPSYPAWKAAALKVLERDHGTAPTAIAERTWTQF